MVIWYSKKELVDILLNEWKKTLQRCENLASIKVIFQFGGMNILKKKKKKTFCLS